MWSLLFWKCTIVLMVSVQTFLKTWKGWPMPPKPRHKLSKMSLSPSKNVALSCARLVSLLWEVREIDLREVLPVLVVILVVSSFFFCFSNFNALQNLRSGVALVSVSEVFWTERLEKRLFFNNVAFLSFFFVKKLFFLLFLERSRFYRKRMRSEIPESEIQTFLQQLTKNEWDLGSAEE